MFSDDDLSRWCHGDLISSFFRYAKLKIFSAERHFWYYVDMPQPSFEKAIEYAYGQLEEKLPLALVYHNLWHSQVEVTTAVWRYANMESVPDYETKLLLVAAAYHDIGFIQSPLNHEVAGTKVVQTVLPLFGFVAADIDQIVGMVLATRLPQTPKNRLEMIMADADLDILGRDDFFERNALLRQEMAWGKRPFSHTEWLENQLLFLSNHSYFTKSAREERRQGKAKNIKAIQAKLNNLR